MRPHHPCSIRQPEPERRREPARGQEPEPARGPEPEQRPEPERPAGSCPRRTATERHRPEPEHSTTERPEHKPGRTEPGRPEHSTTERPEHSATHRPERPEHSTTGQPAHSTTERPEHSTTCGDGLCSSEPHRPNQRSRTPRPTPPFQTVYHSCEILLWVGNLTRRKHSPPRASNQLPSVTEDLAKPFAPDCPTLPCVRCGANATTRSRDLTTGDPLADGQAPRICGLRNSTDYAGHATYVTGAAHDINWLHTVKSSGRGATEISKTRPDPRRSRTFHDHVQPSPRRNHTLVDRSRSDSLARSVSAPHGDCQRDPRQFFRWRFVHEHRCRR